MNTLKKLLFTAISAVITGFVALATDTPLGVETPMTGGWQRMVQTDSGTDLVLCYTDTAAAGFTWTVPSNVSAIDYLVVGGGGAGGSYHRCGGGGAGGLVTNAVTVTSDDVFLITVGAGGQKYSKSTTKYQGRDGSSSTLTCEAIGFAVEGVGGGGGGAQANGRDGGSGGGAGGRNSGSTVRSGGASTQNIDGREGLGNDGGASASSGTDSGGGGGGGAGAKGTDAPGKTGGAGGIGVMSTITGEEKWYAGGGGGGGASNGGLGGSSVGGNGTGTNGTDGAPGTGSGGGGSGNTGTYQAGSGGSGVVIIRYTVGATPTYVAQVNGEGYESVETALAAVQALEASESFPITVTCLAEAGLTIPGAEGESVTLAKDETITITAGSWTFSGSFVGNVTLAPGKSITAAGIADGSSITTVEGYKVVPVENPDGSFTYTSVEVHYVADVDGQQYETFAEALAAVADENSLITLLDDIELDVDVGIGCGLELNGKTISVKEGEEAKLILNYGAITDDEGDDDGRILAPIVANVNVDFSDIEYVIGSTITLNEVATDVYAQLSTAEELDYEDEDAKVLSGVEGMVVTQEGGEGAYTYSLVAEDPTVYVAQIGNVKYETLAEAVAAADGTEPVKILTDITLTERITISGKTVDFEADAPVTVSCEPDRVLYILNNAEVTVGENVTLSSAANPTVMIMGVQVKTDAGDGITSKLVVNGKIENTNETFDQAFAICGNGMDQDGADITIGETGTVLNPNCAAIYFPMPGTLTVNGTISGYSAIIAKDGAITINEGAVVTATGANYQALPLNRDGSTPTGDAIVGGYYPESMGYGVPQITINGGTITVTAEGAKGVNAYDHESAVAPATSEGNVAVKGGEFNAPVDEAYCAPGYIPAYDPVSGKYGVKEGEYVAEIAGVKYETLDAAIDAADGATEITLLANITGTVLISAGKEITLDFNGYELTAGWGIKNSGKLTIVNGNITAQEAAVALYGNSVTTIESGTFTSADNAVIMGQGSEQNGNVKLVVNGGTFNGTIQSAGYIACGFYAANSGVYELNGGVFNITDGCGVCARAGQVKLGENVVFNVSGTITGKVGDKNVQIPCVAVYNDYSEPPYPGYQETDSIKSKSNALSVADGFKWSDMTDDDGYYELVEDVQQDWPEDPTTVTGQKAGDAFEGIPTELANVDAAKLAVWAKGEGKVAFADRADILTEAYLLNCENTQPAVDAAKANFKFTAITVGDEITFTVNGAEGYNGKIVYKGCTNLVTQDWHDKTDGDKFFKAVLVVDELPAE